MPRILFEDMKAEFKRILISRGCDADSADLSAQLMTETSCDGVYSHGVNRFPRVIDYIEKGYIDVKLKFLRLSTQKPLDFCASPSEGRQWAVFFEFQM